MADFRCNVTKEELRRCCKHHLNQYSRHYSLGYEKARNMVTCICKELTGPGPQVLTPRTPPSTEHVMTTSANILSFLGKILDHRDTFCPEPQAEHVSSCSLHFHCTLRTRIFSRVVNKSVFASTLFHDSYQVRSFLFYIHQIFS